MQIDTYRKALSIVDQLKSEKISDLDTLQSRRYNLIGELLAEIFTVLDNDIGDDLDGESWYEVLKQQAADFQEQYRADRAYDGYVESELGV
jgi:hypothetical protein